MNIALACDHAGFAYKEILLPGLRKEKHQVIDLGVSSDEPADYPDIAEKMAEAIHQGRVHRSSILMA